MITDTISVVLAWRVSQKLDALTDSAMVDVVCYLASHRLFRVPVIAFIDERKAPAQTEVCNTIVKHCEHSLP